MARIYLEQHRSKAAGPSSIELKRSIPSDNAKAELARIAMRIAKANGLLALNGFGTFPIVSLIEKDRVTAKPRPTALVVCEMTPEPDKPEPGQPRRGREAA